MQRSQGRVTACRGESHYNIFLVSGFVFFSPIVLYPCLKIYVLDIYKNWFFFSFYKCSGHFQYFQGVCIAPFENNWATALRMIKRRPKQHIRRPHHPLTNQRRSGRPPGCSGGTAAAWPQCRTRRGNGRHAGGRPSSAWPPQSGRLSDGAGEKNNQRLANVLQCSSMLFHCARTPSNNNL